MTATKKQAQAVINTMELASAANIELGYIEAVEMHDKLPCCPVSYCYNVCGASICPSGLNAG